MVIATVGVVITAAITGIAAYFVLGVPLIVALLLGATLSSTDPATLVPIFRQVHIRDRVAQTVMSAFGVQRRDGRDRHLRRAGGGDGERRVLVDGVDCSICSSNRSSASSPASRSDMLAALLIAHEQWAFLANMRRW